MKRIICLAEKRSSRFLFLWLSGFSTGLTLIFPNAGLLEWISLIPAALVLFSLINTKVKLRTVYGYGLFFFMSFYTVVFHWFIYLYPLEFTGMSRGAALAVVLLGCLGLSFLQAIVGGLVFLFTVLFSRLSIVKRHQVLIPFAAAALWVVHEWGQTLFWSGVPWGRLPIGQTDMPIMIQVSSLFGSYAVTFALVAVNFCLALAIREMKWKGAGAMLAASILLINLLAGGILFYINDGQKNAKVIRAALIQGNIASGEKWDMSLSDIIDVYENLSLQAAKEGDPDIIIWPETAIPTSYIDGSNTAARIRNIVKECGVPIMVGLFTDDAGGNEYNSLMLFLPDGSVSDDVYSKRHLVPFGEYMPMRKIISTLLPPLAEIAMLDEDLAPGKDSGLIRHDGVVYGPLICFDSIYEGLVRESVLDGAEIIVISTNDSWFLDSAAGRMHNAQAKLRAVESGRYVLRAANTGISSVITPAGKTIDSLPPLEGGYIIADVATRQNINLYMRIGNVFVAAAALFCVILMAADAVFCSGKKKTG